MLFPAKLHDGLRTGAVTVAFRAWKRPTVRAGGTLHSPGGLLAIDEVTPISAADITPADAAAAGASSVDEVVADLRSGAGRTLYRIRFQRLGEDPRTALRNDDDLSPDERTAIDAQLRRWDAASPDGPWTAALLDLIAAHPARPSRELAQAIGAEQAKLKRRVRQLKGLGLTESLEKGYRPSPRGERYRTDHR